MHDARVSDSPGCGVTYGRIPRDRWPASLLEAVTEDWLLELQESRQHGTHQLALIEARSAQPPAELSFDHDDEAATLHVGRVHVAEHWRGHGLARGLYDLLHELRPYAAVIHTELSPHGQRLVATLPPGWNMVRPRMLDPLPLECSGSMIDPGPEDQVRMVHAADWCPVHECDCGTAEDQELLDDQEELVDLHLDGEPFDPWWPHELLCGVRHLLPRLGVGVTCGCWHPCSGISCDDESHDDGAAGPLPTRSALDTALKHSLASAADLLRGLTPSAQQQAVAAWVTSLRRELPVRPDPKQSEVVAPQDTWARFVASSLPVEAGALPGCVTHPDQWGKRVEQLYAIESPAHGYVPGCCSDRSSSLALQSEPG
jgi:GNAT superfamily N-acetyltransferase